MICTEQFLDDIVEVRLYKRTGYPMAATPFVPYILEAEVVLPTPVVVLSMTPPQDTQGVSVAFLESATLKVTSKTDRNGVIYSHDLSCVVQQNIDTIINAVSKLSRHDVYLIYVKADGTMYMTYTLPNATSLSTEDNAGSAHTLTIKASQKSFSPLIKATFRKQDD